MPVPGELYPVVLTWLQASAGPSHATAVAALGHLVCALLSGQSLHPAVLMRALLSPTAVPARQRYKRVARAWGRPWLSPAWLCPRLVRAALALVPPTPGEPTVVALDSVRCWKWEVFTLGVLVWGRLLPVGWRVLPYPWPKKAFTPTVCALIEQVAAAWPAERAAHLVADRAFPSRPLFRTLRRRRWGWTIRLRARSWVSLSAGAGQWARDLLPATPTDGWRTEPGAYGAGPHAIAGTLAIGRGQPVVPLHQRGPASQRARAAQQARRQKHLASKHPGRRPDASAQTDAWVILFSTHPTAAAAAATDRRRWGTEGFYRDGQSGWDGQHGWNLETRLRGLTRPEQVERVVGLWVLGSLLQNWLGAQTVDATCPPAVQAAVAQWSTSGRLSIFARGQLLLREPSAPVQDWVAQTLRAGAAQIAAAPALHAPVRLPRTDRRPPPLARAA